MIKVPGTPEGIPAFRQLISEGINVNVTLLFAQDVYEEVAAAYIDGVERFAASGGDVGRIASVASFFISRIDTLIDSMAAEKLKTESDPARKAKLQSIMGKVAIANGKLTYEAYERIFSTPRWKALAAKGAQTQRVLWASTSTKNKKYRDVIYVEELIGPDTVNTLPPATLEAFRDHGKPRAESHRRSGRRAQDDVRPGSCRHLDEGSYRQADCRRRETLRRCFRQAPRGGREKYAAPGDSASEWANCQASPSAWTTP